MTSSYDYIKLEKYIDTTVLLIVKLFKDDVKDINSAKLYIANHLNIDKTKVTDYHSNIVDILSSLLSSSKAGDCESFCIVFLSTTHLLQKYILLSEYEEHTELFTKFCFIVEKLYKLFTNLHIE